MSEDSTTHDSMNIKDAADFGKYFYAFLEENAYVSVKKKKLRCLMKQIEQLQAENKKLRKAVDHFEACKEDTIEDGFGSAVDSRCSECGFKTMQVVRPGKFQCGICG